jgi:hypothetical protein
MPTSVFAFAGKHGRVKARRIPRFNLRYALLASDIAQ